MNVRASQPIPGVTWPGTITTIGLQPTAIGATMGPPWLKPGQPNRGKTMTSNEIGVVEAFIAAINRGSPPEIAELMTEDHTFVDSAGRAESGRQNMTAGWNEYFRMFPDYRIVVETILSHNELVAVFGSASGTYNGRRGIVPENRIEMPAAWRAVVQNGKVKRWQVYADWTDGIRTIAEDQAAG